MKAKAVVVALAVALAGCHYQPWPVHLEGTPSDVAELAGEWVGEYSGAQSGRSGSIIFRLSAGRDSAFGDVLMVNQRGGAITAGDSPTEHARHAQSSKLLRIAFVRIEGGRVRGALEPYTEPECDCTLSTTFTGTVSGDVVEGTFITRDEASKEQSGRWRVTRKNR